MVQNSLSLKGLEAYTRDVGMGVARIDYASMDTLSASSGDVIEIKGKRRTVAKCLPLYPSDEGKGIIRIDGLGRNNSGIAIGDTISVRKIKAVAAEKVVVAPLEAIPPIDERYLADALESVPLIKGDNVMVPYFGGRFTFQIVSIIPVADAVLITQKTVFHIAEKVKHPEDETSDSSPPDSSKLSLKVLEAYTKDVGRGVARIGYDTMDTLNVASGDVIEINGKRRTVAKCHPLYPSDEGKEIIRIDELGRNNSGMAIGDTINSGMEIGDTISIRKIKAVAAEKVVIAPLEPQPSITKNYLPEGLGVPLIKDDVVMIRYLGEQLAYQVLEVTPSADAVLITQKTVFHIAEKVKHPEDEKEVPVEKEEMLSTDDPLNILKIRLAKGEITIEEFTKFKEILE